MENKTVKKGEIYLCCLEKSNGSVQYGYRPVLVIQTNEINKYSTTAIVASITSKIKKEQYPTHILIGEECGLLKPSMVELEQMLTVDVNYSLRKYIGEVTDPDKLHEIRRGLAMVFDKPFLDKCIMSLCEECLAKLKTNPDLLIRRIDPLDKNKTHCECCNSKSGYYYAIVNKSADRIFKN